MGPNRVTKNYKVKKKKNAHYIIWETIGRIVRATSENRCLGFRFQSNHSPAGSLPFTVVITFVNYTGVKFYLRIQNVFTVCKLAVCGLVIAGGLYRIYLGIRKNNFNADGFPRLTNFVYVAILQETPGT